MPSVIITYLKTTSLTLFFSIVLFLRYQRVPKTHDNLSMLTHKCQTVCVAT